MSGKFLNFSPQIAVLGETIKERCRVGAETAADMGEEEVDMVELREEEMVDKVNE